MPDAAWTGDEGDERAPSPHPRFLGSAILLPLCSILFFAGLIYVLWEAVTRVGLLPDIILPTPLQVAQEFGVELSSGDLLANTLVTLQEALGGFVLAAALAGLTGYVIAHVRPLEILAAPFVGASQGIPVVAVAPIVILLLQATLWRNVVICAVVVFFPLLITTITGLRGIERDLRDVARVFGASRLQTLRHLELPLAAPSLLAGVKLGLTLSITGAIVGEFLGSDSGLGFMINNAVANFEVSIRYVALITLAALSMLLYGLVTLLERIILQWQDA